MPVSHLQRFGQLSLPTAPSWHPVGQYTASAVPGLGQTAGDKNPVRVDLQQRGHEGLGPVRGQAQAEGAVQLGKDPQRLHGLVLWMMALLWVTVWSSLCA
jgi:hypothetical protein